MAYYYSSAAVGLSTNQQFMLWTGAVNNLNTSRKMSHLVSAKVLHLRVHAQNSLENHVDPFEGKLIEDGHVFRQNFSIRSYQIDTECKASIGAIINILQDTALNHARAQGLLGGGLGSSPEMTKKNLIWVYYRMQILVDCYPSWGDVVQVDKWCYIPRKNGYHSDWLISNSKTGEALIQATSMFVMMNNETRRLSKFIKEAKDEVKPYLRDCHPIIKQDHGQKLLGYDDLLNKPYIIRTGLKPARDDIDVNMHVNNAKYISWILESVPLSILESYDLSSVTLEFRKECRIDSVLQSLTTVVDFSSGEETEMNHLLRLETGPEVARGRTTWKPKLLRIKLK